MDGTRITKTSRENQPTQFASTFSSQTFSLDASKTYPVSSEISNLCKISDFTPCAHAQSNILHINYAEKSDD